MNLIDALAALGTVFRGSGVNHEGEKFTGEMRIQPLVGRSAVLLNYKAVLENAALAHEESTLLGHGSDGRLTLWPVMSELPTVLPHYAVLSGAQAEDQPSLRMAFASGHRDDQSVFREEITIELTATGQLVYSHAWGLPGGSFADRSSCCMEPNGA